MLPEAHVSHRISGRLRVKVPSQRGNGPYFSSLQDRLSRLSGVRQVEVNALTGSVLVLHTLDAREVDLKRIAEYAEMQGLFRLGPIESCQTPAFQRIAGMFQGADKQVKSLSGGELDISTLAFLGLSGLGLFQILRGDLAAPAWHVAFWYALGIWVMAQPKRSDLVRQG